MIFGASGDLTRRKLLPSIYNLAADGILPDDFAIIGVARREWTRAVFIQQLRDALPEFAARKVDPALWAKFEVVRRLLWRAIRKQLVQLDRSATPPGGW